MAFDFSFTPTEADQSAAHIPYFEDARADFAPYYSVRNKTIAEAKAEIATELTKLNAGILTFQEGYFGSKPKRYGYIVHVQYSGSRGRIVVAGLPMNGKETEAKITAVRLQALMNVRDWLKAAVTAQVFAPESDMLMQFLLVDGQQTVAQAIRVTGKFPLLAQPVIEGEIVE